MSNRKSRSRQAGYIPRQPTGDYEIGYAKPPLGTRWGPGQSGNLLGRRRKVPTMWEIFNDVLDEMIMVEDQRGRKRRSNESYRQRYARRVVVDAARGDPRQSATLMKIMLMGEAALAAERVPTRPDHLPPTRDELAAHAMMDNYLLARLEGRAVDPLTSAWDLKS